MKKVVTHINPDLDAVASVWLILRFLPGWEDAEIAFCQAGKTLDNQKVDSDPDVLHVDVGWGKLDHHQVKQRTSAAKLCLDYVKKARKGQMISPLEQKALAEMVDVVNQVDNARDLKWSEVDRPRYEFYLHVAIAGVRGMAGRDEETMEFGLKGMDAIFHQTKKRLDAEEELKEGTEFTTPWGKAIGVKTGNNSVLWEGEKKDYCLVVRKDPKSGGVRIYARWDKGVDLTEAYNKFREMDPASEWFLHASKKLLLNMATSRPMTPTKLTLKQIMSVLEKK